MPRADSVLKGAAPAAEWRDLAARLAPILARAKAEGRDSLTEVEGLAMLSAMGIGAPAHRFAASSEAYRALAAQAEAAGGSVLFPGERAVVKVISPRILHKTEAGGVAIVANDLPSILAAMRGMETRFAGVEVEGYTVNEFVRFDPKLGHEILFGYRFAADFGPVVSFGPGGIYAEFLADKFKPGAATLCFSPETATRDSVAQALSESLLYGLLCAGLRNTKPAIGGGELVDAIMAFIGASMALAAAGVSEFEVNPMVVRAGAGGASSQDGRWPASLVALDCLVKLKDFSSLGLTADSDGAPCNAAQDARPVGNIGRVLKPASAAVIGVSEKGMNNGRIILRNLLQ
ncbi:acetate--CoA ligase family protein, partial [bacterium]|nr:acetate--CoA ligase family protein [bacterium]